LNTVKLRIRRYLPDSGQAYWQEYQVPAGPDETVLSALLYIREHLDSTLAFRFSCRYKHCGLCGMEINGRARLACLTRLKAENTIQPLPKLPVIRDLVVDRQVITSLLDGIRASWQEGFQPGGKVLEPPGRRRLAACNECLCCLSYCPGYQGESSFGGPLVFARLAWYFLHPADGGDRPLEAIGLGIHRCQDCPGCRCLRGIPVFREGVRPLLAAAGIGHAG